MPEVRGETPESDPHNVPESARCPECGGFRCRPTCTGYNPDDADPSTERPVPEGSAARPSGWNYEGRVIDKITELDAVIARLREEMHTVAAGLDIVISGGCDQTPNLARLRDHLRREATA